MATMEKKQQKEGGDSAAADRRRISSHSAVSASHPEPLAIQNGQRRARLAADASGPGVRSTCIRARAKASPASDTAAHETTPIRAIRARGSVRSTMYSSYRSR